MSPRRIRAALVGAAVFTLAVAACSSGGTPGATGSGSASGSGDGGSAAGFQAQHKGGTLHLVAKSAAGTLDPMINYTLQYWQLYQASYDGLLAFKKVDGQDSFTVVPDLAEAMPQVSNGDRTYTFKLRQGIKFSNGQPLTTDDVVASFERIFKVSSPTAGTFYNGIDGADACMKTPATCTLPKGVIGDPKTNTVTINLVALLHPAEECPGKGRRHDADPHDRCLHVRVVRTEPGAEDGA
jgi:peptide/nickel transport system substrate-binding protein